MTEAVPGQVTGTPDAPAAGPAGECPRWLPWVLGAGLAAAVVLVQWPALGARALCFDDNQYLTENLRVQNPSGSNAWKFLSEVTEPATVRGYYQPLTMISLMLDAALGGTPEHLAPFRRTSLGLHALNAVLVMVVLGRLFRRWWPAALVGLIFGVHPMTVEVVAWVGERKTLLAACFSLLALAGYVGYVRRGGGWRYGLSLAAFVLALMSKPTSTPLPVLLLLLDVWPLGRRDWRRMVLDKLPFLLIAGVSAAITVISQGRTAAVGLPADSSWLRAPLLMSHAFGFYVAKWVWPAGLTPHYPPPVPFGLGQVQVIWTSAIFMASVLAAGLAWRRSRGPLVCVAFFAVGLLPTLGIVGFTNVLTSDKYAYLPALGLWVGLAGWLSRGWDAPPGAAVPTARQGVIVGLLILLAGGLGMRTQHYLSAWHDTGRLFEHMLALAPDSSALHNNYGVHLAGVQDAEAAVGAFRRAVELQESNFSAQINLGKALMDLHALDEAEQRFKRALELHPGDASACFNLAELARLRGRKSEARRWYVEALTHQPRMVRAQSALAELAVEAGDAKDAAERYRAAVELNPGDAKLRTAFAQVLAKLGQAEAAVEQLEAAVQLSGGDPAIRNNLGSLLAGRGDFAAAAGQFRAALAARPDEPAIRYNLALTLLEQGQAKEAAEQLETLLKQQRADGNTYYQLARARLKLDDRAGACEALQRCLRVAPNHDAAAKLLESLGSP